MARRSAATKAPKVPKAKRRTYYEEGLAMGRLEGRVDAYATIALGALDILGKVLAIGERVETARAQTSSASIGDAARVQPFPASVRIRQCGARVYGSAIASACTKDLGHLGDHEGPKGTWTPCNTRNPNDSCGTQRCNDPIGHLGPHHSEISSWSA